MSQIEERDFCDGETREHVQVTFAKKIGILGPSPECKYPAHTDCADR